MESIIKRLVFAFYLTNDNLDCEVNRLHFACLSHYCSIFDEIAVTFIKDKDLKEDILHEAERRFINIHKWSSISFNVVENSPLRESLVFKKEIVDKLSENKLVFFAHNKGVTNVSKYDKDVIYTWVAGMYFYSLNFIDEVIDTLLNKKYFSYGSFLTKNNEGEHCNKYGWYYIGTFFWMNCGKINTYINNVQIKLPSLSDRFYDEEFLGNIYPTWPFIFTASHENKYIIDAKDYYHNAKEYLNTIYQNTDDFNEFYKNILNIL